jgi:hypothetical protein
MFGRSYMVLIKTIAGTANGKSLLIEQFADTTNQQDFMMLVVTPVAAAFDRLELSELLFPVAQNMRLDPAQLADFTDGEVAFGRDRRQLNVKRALLHMPLLPCF